MNIYIYRGNIRDMPKSWDRDVIVALPRVGDTLYLERPDDLHGFWIVRQVLLTQDAAYVWVHKSRRWKPRAYSDIAEDRQKQIEKQEAMSREHAKIFETAMRYVAEKGKSQEKGEDSP